MKQEAKENISVITAVVLLTSGIVLSFLSFFLSVDNVIDDSVLWYFAQTLIYSGSIFGVKEYIDYRMKTDLWVKLRDAACFYAR